MSGWTAGRYLDIGTTSAQRVVLSGAETARFLECPYVEKAAPSYTAFTIANGFIDWGDVLAGYANWLAVENGNVDWSDVRQ
jgi:hypothetical protein